MNPGQHFSALIGEDPLELVAEIEAAAIVYGKARAAADHAERVRKVKRAEAERAYLSSERADGRKPTIPQIEAAALTSPMYGEHLDNQRRLEEDAAEAEARYYALRNRQDWLHRAADAAKAEAYLAR